MYWNYFWMVAGGALISLAMSDRAWWRGLVLIAAIYCMLVSVVANQ